MSAETLPLSVRITSCLHVSNPVRQIQRLRNPNALLRRATLGTRLEEWEQDERYRSRHESLDLKADGAKIYQPAKPRANICNCLTGFCVDVDFTARRGRRVRCRKAVCSHVKKMLPFRTD